jgi:ElaB/YqjD/DUF883 family membrane-anchored ribosome-binding protein
MNTTTKYGEESELKIKSGSDTSFQKDMNDVKDSITKSAQHVSDKAGDLYNDIKEQTVDMQKEVLTYVKGNPVKAVGFALLAGYLAAILLRK